ncbi:MAG: ATP-binding protein, partial [Actinobacteria bacterium]|nr:ATP-binding protein [Actinomycetota bacterium]
GALNSYTASVALASVWLEADEQVRKNRWKERDGELFDQYFEIWSAQELDFIAREKSNELASYLLDTTVT